MAIQIHCPACKSSTRLGAKACGKCGNSFSQERKYRVIVKTHDGKRVSKVVESLDTARKLEAKLKVQTIERKHLGILPGLAVDAAWDAFLAWAKEHKKSWDKDRQRWRTYAAPFLAGKDMSAVTPHDVQAALDACKRSGCAPATVRQVLVLIKRVFNWCFQMGLYDGLNPASRVKPPKVCNEVTECLTRDQIGRLLAVLEDWPNPRFALLVKFALFTGCRAGEACSLRRQDVDLEKGFITLRNTKGGKDTTLPLSDQALAVVREALALSPRPGCLLVFPNSDGDMRTTLRNSWARVRAKAELPEAFRFHGLRHTFASYLASSGKVSLYTLQKLLTHKSPLMTQRYAHLMDETLREGANALSGMISIN